MNGCGHMGGAWSQHDRPCPTRLRLLISRAMSPLVPVLALKTLEETRGPAPAEGCAPGHDPAGRMLRMRTLEPTTTAGSPTSAMQLLL